MKLYQKIGQFSHSSNPSSMPHFIVAVKFENTPRSNAKHLAKNDRLFQQFQKSSHKEATKEFDCFFIKTNVNFKKLCKFEWVFYSINEIFESVPQTQKCLVVRELIGDNKRVRETFEVCPITITRRPEKQETKGK